ncbi:T9SS type A sorting domain-containing protein [Mucilaginibacter gilvus]|uniref:T9SS type A sorting domain-containing protein n=1 Tax=Mucilaginibacter gilvus TaxID=2305909 RepID=A0A3S3W2X3_9SPHI|nr:T9SS type A sorting domain-containing protein [Mucilaginibacter gilvus]
MLKKGICLLFLMLCFVFCRAQTTRTDRSVSAIYSGGKLIAERQSDSLYYYLVNFNAPSRIASKKFRLLKRVSYNSYILSSAQKINAGENMVAIAPANMLWKADDGLAKLSTDHPNSTKLITLVLNRTGENSVATIRQTAEIVSATGNMLTVKLPLKQLATILKNPNIIFAGLVRKAHTELAIDNIDLGVNSISAIAGNYPGINGSGINVSLKEDNYDETDIDLMGRSFTAVPASPNISGHANIMATLIGGNGNSYIKGLGAAPAVRYTSSDFARLSPDSTPYFKNFNISVQNHSYGVGIENFYGIEAAAYDAQLYAQDTLVHVFSSGNIGTTTSNTGLYNGIANVANLSGTFKQAKNIIVVGGTGRTNIPEALSSAGPAYDGRVKPEFVAEGEDGTSGAAALASGAIALLQQAYKKQYHKLPSGALLKSALINAADDIGTPAVDFKTGYGKLNALEALRILTDGRFKSGSVSNNGQTSYQITVPANCDLLKISLTWIDAPATLNAPSALVNDLDLRVSTPSGQTLLPWVLSIYPAVDSLTKPATRQRDTLNNTEQVTLQNPEAGVYTITVSGNRVTTNAQAFYITYTARLANTFEWTFPSANGQLFAGDDNYLHWQSSYNTVTGQLSVSYNHGLSWQPLANVNLADGFYKWPSPDVFTQAIFKIAINGQEYVGKEFSISKPLTLNVGFNCTDGTLLHWNPQPGTTGYTIYSIKDNILQSLTTTPDTTVIIPATMQTSKYFAVSAQGNGFNGIKSYTIDATTQGVGCYIKTLLADVTADKKIVLSLSVGSVVNLKDITWEKLTGPDKYTVIGSTPIAANGFPYQFTDPAPKKGINYYRAKLVTTDGKIIYSDKASAILLQTDQFTIYPNPVTTQLNILSGELKEYELKLYDAMGILRFSKTFNGLQNNIPVSVIPGIYICTIGLKGAILYKTKIIKL